MVTQNEFLTSSLITSAIPSTYKGHPDYFQNNSGVGTLMSIQTTANQTNHSTSPAILENNLPTMPAGNPIKQVLGVCPDSTLPDEVLLLDAPNIFILQAPCTLRLLIPWHARPAPFVI